MKVQFIGYIRKDWPNLFRWLSNSVKYNPHQKFNKYLAHPVILLERSRVIDGRSRPDQKKILITIEEID
jgi:hypothetical protein